MKKTKWFDGLVKPGIPGVYQRDYRNARGDRSAGITYGYWDGENWGLFGESPSLALRWKDLPSSYQVLPWRGLAQDPKAAY